MNLQSKDTQTLTNYEQTRAIVEPLGLSQLFQLLARLGGHVRLGQVGDITTGVIMLDPGRYLAPKVASHKNAPHVVIATHIVRVTG